MCVLLSCSGVRGEESQCVGDTCAYGEMARLGGPLQGWTSNLWFAVVVGT